MVDHSVSTDANSVSALVRELSAVLQSAGIDQADVEARDIVAVVAGVGRLWPALNGSAEIRAEMRDRARAAARRRARGEPFAYAVGQAAFRHLTLRVDKRVLIPRQETELLVELVLMRMRGLNGGVIADIGTGSGAIALALATEIQNAVIPAPPTVIPAKAGTQGRAPWIPAFAGMTREVDAGVRGLGKVEKIIATDISRGALQVAEQNAQLVLNETSVPVEFRCGDMFSVIRETGLCAIVSNPPYIAFEEARSLPSSVRNWEPPEALYSDRQGMRAIARLVKGSAGALEKGGLLALEVDSNRASLAAELVLTSGSFRDVSVELDLTGRERFVLATKA